MNYWKTCQLVMSLPLLGGGKSRLDSLERQPFRYSKYCEESLHKATRQSQSYCHSERSEESLKESLVAKRDSSVVSLPQNDNGIKSTSIPKSNASQKAHSNSSPLAGVQNDNESNPQDKITLQGKLVCHSEGAQGATEESLPESLVASRDSSLDSQAQNDNLRESL
ncbi:hypothetical protein, partial [Helicobacter marmotae]|uniref:hypothetical protein n=1 Tax=Helicobacter marmotae TaxID=152490 RepID=UPI0013151858